ncbi:MAG: YhbY family RNA-binding protein [bacterium]
MESLTETQKKYLRGKAHALKPVVMIGQHGMKDSIQEEIHQALSFHQMIKIKIAGGEREERQALIALILEKNQALLVQQIGHIAIIYKRNTKKASLFAD